jgi:hypothetical protein
MEYGKCINLFFTILILQHYPWAIQGMMQNDGREFLVEASKEFDKDNFMAEYSKLGDELNTQFLETINSDVIYVKVEDPIFKSYITSIVENALEQGLTNVLPHGFLQCYEQISNNKNVFLIEDLRNVIKVSLDVLADTNTKVSHPKIHPIVGPLLCNTAVVIDLLLSIESLLVQCCNNNTVDFGMIFSDLAYIKNTLTICCENITNDFNGTFSALAEFETTLTNCCAVEFFDLSGTYSALNYGFNSTETIITADFNGTVTLLDAITIVLNEVLTTLTSHCASFETQIDNCCTSLFESLLTLGGQVANAVSIVASFLGHECNNFCVASTHLVPDPFCPTAHTCG